MKTATPKPRRRRQRNAIEGLADDAYGTLVEAALTAKKIATLQHVQRLLEEIKSMLEMEGFVAALERQPGVTVNYSRTPQPPPVPDNPCVECGRDGFWQAPSTRQWFCVHHEALGKQRYADDKTTRVSPELKVVQTPQTAQRATPQPPVNAPQPVLMATAEGGQPALQEQAPAVDVLKEEMNRLINGGV